VMTNENFVKIALQNIYNRKDDEKFK
jgi:hypothetical protein